MQYIKPFLLFQLILLTLYACRTEVMIDMNPVKDYAPGMNKYTLTSEGVERSYYVHVPSSFSVDSPTPVVFMLHGSGGNGLKFYTISGWKEVGEKENILTVFPSSWKHCITKDGMRKNTTKWHVYPGSFGYCQGEQPLDDVAFIRAIIDTIIQRFHVDSKRIYLVGFSNGGEMASRCAIELSDRLAAVVMASGVNLDQMMHVPKRLLPITIQVGTDENFDTPMDIQNFETLLKNPSKYHLDSLIQAVQSTFRFSPEFTPSGNPDSLRIAVFPPLVPSDNHTLRFMMINHMKHLYPNGKNHFFYAAKEHWSWLKQYTLP